MMPFYEFAATNGDTIEEFFQMSEAPTIGSRITRGGVKYRRLPDVPGGIARKTVRFEDVQTEAWVPDAPRYSPDGRAQFESKREVEEFCRKRTGAGVEMIWDD